MVQRHSEAQTQFTIQRLRQVLAVTGRACSTLYEDIRKGLWPPGIRIGGVSVGWLEHETQAILAARVAGKSDEEIRQLVNDIVVARKAVGGGS